MSASAKPQAGEVGELHTNWRLLLAATLGVGLGLPTLPFYTVGIFAHTFASEFGWSYASIFGGLVPTTAALLFGGPIVGHLVDRYGPRKITAVSLAGLGIGYMALAFSNGSIIQYYASWIVFSVVGLGATSISFTRAIHAAFDRRRGLALGITLAGIGIFALLVKPLASWLIAITGWRGAIVGIGLLPLLIGVPAVLWGFRAAPTVHGVHTNTAASVPGLSLKEALRTRTFKLMVLAFVPISFANGAPIPNMENILRSVRVGAEEIVTLTSMIGVTMVAGRLIGGWLLDRIWAPLAGIVVLTGASLGCWVLSQQTVSSHQAMIAVMLLGFAGGVEVDLLSYLTARYLGVRSYGAVYGTLFGLFAIGAGAGPSLLGFAYDRAGSYSQIMLVCALLLLFAACLLIGLGRYPDHSDEAAMGRRPVSVET